MGCVAMEVSSKDLQLVLNMLGSIPFLQRLPAESFQQITQVSQLQHFEKGEPIVKAGEAGEGLYIIWKGESEVLRILEETKVEQLPPVLRKGDQFGHACLGPRKQLHSHDIVARSEVSCIIIPHCEAQLLSPTSTWRHHPEELTLVECLLQLEFIKDDLFRFNPMAEAPSFWNNMYGGHIVGLALGAACKTVDPALVVHSLHSYFIYSGTPSLPVNYKVERIRNGHTFATRHVQAIQKGKIIFALYASFQRAEKGLEYQYPMPTMPTPNELPTYEDLLGPLCDDKRLSKHNQQASSSSLRMNQTLDLKYHNRRSPLSLEPQEPRQRVWMRTRGKLSDDLALHRYVTNLNSNLMRDGGCCKQDHVHPSIKHQF
uniref:Cyclic nucleotide-binding domain-containing protein n=1 Tax=Physcomitrium patens TaxID=3218 RepID=A0A7I4AHW1_PHYPA